MAGGSDVYSDFVKSLLDAENARKSSLEQRGINIITTSGALVTLLFGLVATITSAKTFTLPSVTHGWLAAAEVLFVAAAFLGIGVNIPLFYGKIVVVEETVRSAWNDSVSDAQAAVTSARLKRLHSAQMTNSVKAWILLLGALTELAAIAVLAVGIVDLIQLKK